MNELNFRIKSHRESKRYCENCPFRYFFTTSELKLFNLKYIAQKNKQTQGFRKIRSFCYKIRIFDGCLSFEHFARHQGETLRITRTHPAGAKNMHGDPIFLLQFLNVLYMAGICVKFKKKIWIVHHFQVTYIP